MSWHVCGTPPLDRLLAALTALARTTAGLGIRLARLAGLEPATGCLEGSCSIQLSYRRLGAHCARCRSRTEHALSCRVPAFRGPIAYRHVLCPAVSLLTCCLRPAAISAPFQRFRRLGCPSSTARTNGERGVAGSRDHLGRRQERDHGRAVPVAAPPGRERCPVQGPEHVPEFVR